MNEAGRVWVLVAHDLRRRTRSVIIWGVALGALGAMYVALFPTMGSLLDTYVNDAPEQMQQFMGNLSGPITIEQWLGLEFLNFLVPIALSFMAMAIGARTVAGSEERKTLDLLLSNPLPRWQVIAGAVGTIAAALAAVLFITWALTMAAVPAAGVDLGPGHLAKALLALWPLCLVFGTLAVLASSLLRRGALAIAVPGVILVAMYVIDGLGQVSESIKPLRVVSLFYHLGPTLESDFPWTAFVVMLAATAVIGAAAVAAFIRRDIYT